MAYGRPLASQQEGCSLASLVLVAMLGALASCESNGDVLLPTTKGGDGTVIRIPADGGRDATAGSSTAQTGGHGGSQATGAAGSVGTGGTGAGGAGAGGTGAGGKGTGGTIAAGGASGAGGGVVDDPCTACEK